MPELPDKRPWWVAAVLPWIVALLILLCWSCLTRVN
jgi:hypothetical protein